jgi:hypothetical protein
METNTRVIDEREAGDANLDPISGAPGSHPIGTGIGAAIGGAGAGIATAVAGGAALGSAIGPVGTVIGAAVGAVVGGLAGKAVAEAIDPTAEEAYWRDNFGTRDYASSGSYESFRPAYGLAVDSFDRHPNKTFDDVESSLAREWPDRRMDSTLDWNVARPAARDAWDRLRDPKGASLATESAAR